MMGHEAMEWLSFSRPHISQPAAEGGRQTQTFSLFHVLHVFIVRSCEPPSDTIRVLCEPHSKIESSRAI